MILTYSCDYLEENPTLSNFIDFLIDVKNQHGDIKIATYDYEFGGIKRAVFDNMINIYLSNFIYNYKDNINISVFFNKMNQNNKINYINKI